MATAGRQPPLAVDQRAVLVLGMHRSGTSCLAGSLQQRGLHLGQVKEWNPHNRKGNRENPAITRLNDDVLEHSGGAWDRPPPAVTWTDSHVVARDAAVVGLAGGASGLWGFKDPRTLLTLDFWLEALPGARLVGTFRHPVRVARSLSERRSMSFPDGLELWRAYNRRLLDLLDVATFPMVSFDLPDPAYAKAVDGVARTLGLENHDASPDEEFFDTSLRSQHAPDASPEELESMHRDLIRFCPHDDVEAAGNNA